MSKKALAILASTVIPILFACSEQPQCHVCDVDPLVWRVAGGGFWERSNNEYGNFRIIVRNQGWEHTRSLVYLQWLKSDEKNETLDVLLSIAVPELNSGSWRNVSDIEYRNDAFIISFVSREEEDVVRTAFLQPRLPGDYGIEFQ
jgi:hypothetical protein